MNQLVNAFFVAAACHAWLVPVGGNLDRFNYDKTAGSDYGPKEWINVSCADSKVCQGWPDSFEMGIDWKLQENSCFWCPAEDDELCGMHHQSPIDLQRNRAIEDEPLFNECIDIHWMAYFDSSCNFETLKELNAFSIERHTLKISQPLEEFEPRKYRLGCRDSKGRRWGKIDFSKGFSHWWHLSHVDFHVPSEHTQEGKRYAGELQMYHWYSVNATVAGVNNEMAAVTVFFEAYHDTPDYDVLNRIICQWREVEEKNRAQCGLPSVLSEYPGCFYHRRPANSTPSRRQRETDFSSVARPLTAHDVIIGNAIASQQGGKPRVLVLEEEDLSPMSDFDWDSFIASQYDGSKRKGPRRRLINYDHVGPWFNYFAMLGVRTEYYYRYSGTQTVPPCYGKWFSGNNRRQTNHWRVMKDPLRVSQRQIREMHRLLRERIAPADDPLNPCEPDTAGKVDSLDPTKISVARPSQSFREVHFKVFCECEDWASKWVEDQEWCQMEKLERFYEQPYNYETDGF